MDLIWAATASSTLLIFQAAGALWASVFVEWLSLQALILYTLYKTYTSLNSLRQVVAVMCLLVLLCLYLGLWQLELFACFLFIGEFTIFIFFYCLFLHLKSGVTNRDSRGSGLAIWPWTGFLLVTFLAVMGLNAGSYSITSSAHLVMQDIYRLIHDFALNDLSALLVFFVKSNPFVHLLLGLFLFVLTLFLFAIVSLYTTSGIQSKEFYRSSQDKLYLARGYYEQTAEASQKSFSGKQ